MIDHADVREFLELAAVEPGGLERLSAGDTAEAAVVAGHLAGCPSCAEEARRLATAAPIVRDVVGSIPPDALRERTLTLVRQVGRARGAPAPVSTAIGLLVDPRVGDRLRRRQLGWPVALAATIVISLVVGGAVVGVRSGQDLRDQQAQTADLAKLDAATLSLAGKPDVQRVALIAMADTTVTGTLLFSSTARDLVMSASGLKQPPVGQAFSCWMTGPDGARIRIGTMAFGGGLAYWAGWTDQLAAARPGTKFGVTLIDGSGKPVGGDVLVGTVTNG
jgi:hypothetical protein